MAQEQAHERLPKQALQGIPARSTGRAGAMGTSRALRTYRRDVKLRAAVVAALALLPVLPAAPAGAATSYSAPLRTAVRELPVAAESNAGHDRHRYFGQWIDADRDCRSTRHEVLAAETSSERWSRSGCTVVAGS